MCKLKQGYRATWLRAYVTTWLRNENYVNMNVLSRVIFNFTSVEFWLNSTQHHKYINSYYVHVSQSTIMADYRASSELQE